MSARTRLMLLHGLIGLSFAAIVLIGGVFVATGGEAGGVPTIPIILLAFAMAAERRLRTKAPTDAR